MQNNLFLADCCSGKIVKVVEILADKSIISRLFELGLIPDATLQIIHIFSDGQCLIRVKNSKLAISPILSKRIIVKNPTK